MNIVTLQHPAKRPYVKASITVVMIQPVAPMAASGTGATTDNFVWENEEEQP